MTNTYRLLDLDNCIADDRWRIRQINWQKVGNPRYHDYHMLCGFDEIGNRELIRTNERIIVMTGRPNIVRGITEEWLARKGVHWHAILMRPDDDARPSAEVKRWQLESLRVHWDIDFNDITSAFDDHPSVIEMYRGCGIPSFLKSIHDVSAYINPTTKELAL